MARSAARVLLLTAFMLPAAPTLGQVRITGGIAGTVVDASDLVVPGAADYIAIHTYIANRENDFERYMAWSQTIALAMGLFFNSFFRHADVVKMANVAQMVNVIAPMMTNKDGLFLQPTYFPIAEYSKQRGNTAVDVWVTAPTYRVGNRPPLQYLDVSSSYNPVTRDVFLNVLNRSKDRDLTTDILNQEGTLAAGGSVWELNHPDLKATHTFGDDKKIRPVTRPLGAAAGSRNIRYTFPAHSLTILRFKLQ